MNELTLEEQANELPISGSLTFRMCVVQRDWEAVSHLASQQIDSFHGISVLTQTDREYLITEAQKDGVALHL